jgi:hypothetical protein
MIHNMLNSKFFFPVMKDTKNKYTPVWKMSEEPEKYHHIILN